MHRARPGRRAPRAGLRQWAASAAGSRARRDPGPGPDPRALTGSVLCPHRWGVGYRDDREATRLREDALEASAREFAERVAEAEAEAAEELRRAEEEPALRNALAILTRPQPPFTRPEPEPPSKAWTKAMAVVVLGGGALFAVAVLVLSPGGW